MDDRCQTARAVLAVVTTTVVVAGAVAGNAVALQPALSVSATTTVGEEPVTAIAHRAGQTAELHIDYAEFGQGPHEISINLQVSGVDPRSVTRDITVSGGSGTETVRLDDLFDLTDIQSGSTLQLTVLAEGVGPDGQFELQDSMTIELVPATIYLTDVPEVVLVDEQVTVGYYGWGREPLHDGVRLYADRSPLGVDEQGEDTVVSTDDIEQTADPFFEGSFAFVPERELADLGSSLALQARPSPQAEDVPGSDIRAVSLNRRPDAVIAYSPEDPTVGESVVFNAADSTDPDGEIVEYRWDLDDDGDFEARGSVPARAYDSDGERTVTLRVIDDDGATDDATVSLFVVAPTTEATPEIPGWPDLWPDVAAAGGVLLVVSLGFWLRGPLKRAAQRAKERTRKRSNHPPISVPGYAPRGPAVNRPVLFDGSLSFDPDPDDTIRTYRWTIGGDEHVTPRVVHVFGDTGEHTVSLEVNDKHGASTSSSETVTVEAREGTLELLAVNPDSPGNDHENLDDEYLVFKNTGDAPLDVGGWTLHDAAEEAGRVEPDDHTFEFDEGIELPPGATVTVHTGSAPARSDEWTDTAEARHLFWGMNTAVWNNEEDLVVIEDDRGTPSFAARYQRDDAGVYEVDSLDHQSLLDWFPAVEVEATADTPAGGVGIDIGLESLKSIRALVAGAFFLRGPVTFLKAWGIVTVAVVGSATVGFASSSQGFVLPLVLLPVTLAALLVGVVWLVGRWVMGFFRS